MRSVVTTSAGTYRVQLAPGLYSVRFARTSRIARLTPVAVTVRSGRALRRDFTIDTGIR